MKQKTFFTIAALIFVMMAVYFTIQMQGSAQKQCSYDFGLYCMQEVFEECPYGIFHASIYWSCCLGSGVCGAVWTVYCESDNWTPVITTCSCDGYDPSECGSW